MSIAVAPPRGNAAGLFVSSGQIARRVLRKFVRSPQLVVVGTIQGAMFLLIFRYVFGGAIAVRGVNYVDFVVRGSSPPACSSTPCTPLRAWPRT